MKNIVLVSLVAAIAIGIATVFLIFSNEPKGSSGENLSPQVVAPAVTNQASEPTSGSDTLESLLSRAEDLECTIAYIEEVSGQPIEGTYFTSRGKMRGDFVVTSELGEVVSSVIMKDETFYSWSLIAGETYGMKISLDDMAKQKATGQGPDTKEPVPLDVPVNYSCKAWQNVDGSIFEPPTNVLFKDYADVVNTGMEFGTVYDEAGGKSAQCALCEKVEAGPGKDECLATFSCL